MTQNITFAFFASIIPDDCIGLNDLIVFDAGVARNVVETIETNLFSAITLPEIVAKSHS